MQRSLSILGIILFAWLATVAGQAQQDRLEGRWEGTVQSPQGERRAVASFKKDGQNYTGTITGRGDSEMPFKEVKLDGDKVTATAQVDTPQGSIIIKYDFVLQGDTLKGKGEVDFGGQTFSFNYDLKRAADTTAQRSDTSQQPQQGSQQANQQRQQQSRAPVPQPQQKQSLEYFVGQWNFKWIGRDSPLGPGGPREGIATFKLSSNGKSLEGRLEGKSEEGSFWETAVITFDEATKWLTFSERRSNGVQIQSKGDWSSPISIRFNIEPIKVKGQTLNLKRTISVVSAHSFTVVEELSEDGGPFVRLGSGIYSKVGSQSAK